MRKLFNRRKIRIFIVIILAILTIGASLWFIYNFKYLEKEGSLKVEHRFKDKSTFVNKRIAIDNIKPWMTFNYLNVIFKLNPIYLKNSLNITDSRYPNIRIDQYTRKNNLNPFSYIEKIKSVIINNPTNN